MPCVFFKEYVTTFAVSVVGEAIKNHNGTQASFIFGFKVEIMVIGIVFDVMLERTRTQRGIFTQHSIRDNVPAKRLADKVSCNLPARQTVFREVPKWLFPFLRFIYSLKFFLLILYGYIEAIIRAKCKLTLEFHIPVF